MVRTTKKALVAAWVAGLHLGVVVTALPGEELTRLTPFGAFPADCVRDVAPGTSLRLSENGTRVDVIHDASGRVLDTHRAQPHCLEHANALLKARRRRRTSSKAASEEDNNGRVAKQGGPREDSGWLDYVEYYPTAYLSYFEGFYTVPAAPPADDAQVLFYFIGTENIAQEGGSITILQPVLTWGNGHEAWNMASWNCCPAGEATTSDFLLNLEPGATVYGNISVDYDAQVATVVSQVGDDAVSLSIAGELREFDWMDVTLEVYTVNDCAEFAASDLEISQMNATDLTGAPIVPDWEDATGETDCGGAQTFTATTWSVHHDVTATSDKHRHAHDEDDH